MLPRQDFGLIYSFNIPKPSATSIGPHLLLHPQHLCFCLKNTSSHDTKKPQKRMIETAACCQVLSRKQIERFTWITSFLDLKSTSITPLLIKMITTTMMTITVVAVAVAESNSDSSGGNGDSDGSGGGIGSKDDCDGSGNDSNNSDNGGSCNSDGDDDDDDASNDEEDSHDDNDTTVVAVRAAGMTKTTTVTAMAGGTCNNQLKAQLHPAHVRNEDDMPGMCLAVVVVVAMTVWEGWSAMATVEEAAMAAAEEADDGRGGLRCAVNSFLVRLFFSKAKATVRPLSFLPQTLLVDCCLHRFHHCCHCRCRWCRHCLHCCRHCHYRPYRHHCCHHRHRSRHHHCHSFCH